MGKHSLTATLSYVYWPAFWDTLPRHTVLVGCFWNKERGGKKKQRMPWEKKKRVAFPTRTCVNKEQAIWCRAMAGYVIWSGISISGKQNGTWGWACNYCVLKNPSMWRPCSAFKTSYLFLSLVLSILHTGHRFSHRKNAREWIWTEYGISMADSRAHSQSQELHGECGTPCREGCGTRSVMQEHMHHPELQVQSALILYHRVYWITNIW